MKAVRIARLPLMLLLTLLALAPLSSQAATPATVTRGAAATWTVTGSLHEAREAHTATRLLNGQVLIAGGLKNSGGSLAWFQANADGRASYAFY